MLAPQKKTGMERNVSTTLNKLLIKSIQEQMYTPYQSNTVLFSLSKMGPHMTETWCRRSEGPEVAHVKPCYPLRGHSSFGEICLGPSLMAVMTFGWKALENFSREMNLTLTGHCSCKI